MLRGSLASSLPLQIYLGNCKEIFDRPFWIVSWAHAGIIYTELKYVLTVKMPKIKFFFTRVPVLSSLIQFSSRHYGKLFHSNELRWCQILLSFVQDYAKMLLAPLIFGSAKVLSTYAPASCWGARNLFSSCSVVLSFSIAFVSAVTLAVEYVWSKRKWMRWTKARIVPLDTELRLVAHLLLKEMIEHLFVGLFFRRSRRVPQ